jgi:hypothetical protein
MDLNDESQAALMRAARLCPDEKRDAFFSDVARRLKYIRYITVADVRYASSAALGDLRDQSGSLKRTA